MCSLPKRLKYARIALILLSEKGIWMQIFFLLAKLPGRKALLLEPSEARDRLTDGIFVSRNAHDVTGRMEHALERVLAAEPVEKKLRERKISDPETALAAGIISPSEAALLKEAADAVLAAISVDDFPPEAIGKGVEQSTRQKPAVVLSM